MATFPPIPVDPNLRAPERELTPMEKLQAMGAQLKSQFQKDVGSMSQPRAVTDVLNRGVVAGLLGAPVDLANLPIQALVPGMASEAPVGGSEWLGRQMERLGLVTPTRRPTLELAASIPSPLAAFQGAQAVGRAAKAMNPAQIQKYVRSAQQAGTPLSGGALPGAAVIKPKGGNWIDRSVSADEDTVAEAVTPLRRMPLGQEPAERLQLLEQAVQQQREAGMLPSAFFEERTNVERGRLMTDAAVNKWVDTKLARYIKNEMATPEDPIRKLVQEKGVTHISDRDQFTEVNEWLPDEIAALRAEAGYPEEGIAYEKFMAEGAPAAKEADTRLAQAWENVTDSAITSRPAGELQEVSDIPWLRKLDPNTKMYEVDPRMVSEDLGFDHLLDELRNAIRPDSDLPARLRWTPEQLQKVSVPQAVERVDEINKWRREQDIAETAKAARNPATFTFKEYPEQNMRWVELKAPEKFAERGARESLTPQEDEELMDLATKETQRFIRDEGEDEYRAEYLWQEIYEDLKAKKLAPDTPEKALQEALDYEGATMSHCVGGYCPDVVAGRARIFSLRDEKDVPQVTIEVRPGRQLTEKDLPNDVRDMLAEQYGDASREEFEAAVQQYLQDKRVPPEIVQIKGKANRAPKAEHIPMVQDFIRSQEWGRIGDIENAGMVAIAPDSDIAQAMLKAGQTPPKYATQDELTNLLKQYRGYAKGGRVTVEDPVQVERLQRFADGGSVKHPAAQGLPDPSLTNFSLYADTVSREMYPTKAENAKRDAARHILASALATQKMGPGVSEFLGKAYEFKEAPIRTAGHWLGLSEPRPDYPTDIFNNSVGIEIGQKAKTMDELLGMVEQAVNKGTLKQEPGKALLVPDPIKTKYASGGVVNRGKIQFDDPVKLRRIKQLGLK